ncbi:hypothetical protein EV193_10941 [Herbihabitans rhizosphaerae]|uniref:Uncharacterized protein n=1 Tax=Herbihabitans rhizosphaerae TaxID=1872711 RepID=A0A4Q7KI54_9PSEU|nr:hypothetical protein [Herbihabitans rhizosphaerae]RZS34254.1 hypothetical protein EV193_10941 [Herbihabitans rhizosphaerae]
MRPDAFVVRQRLRIGGVISGALLVASTYVILLAVLTVPWWIGQVFNEVNGIGSFLITCAGVLVVIGLPAAVAVVAASRPGNAALRRRELVLDADGMWIYESALWWTPPRLIPWAAASPMRGVPWDYLVFGDPPQGACRLVYLTASPEEIVAHGRHWYPGLEFADER